MLSLTASVSAASFVVNDPGDVGDGTCDATCTLRDAIGEANATPEADTITFNPGITTITLTNGTLNINEDLAIQGPGSGLLLIQDNNLFICNSPTFQVYDEAVVTATGFALQNKSCSEYGFYQYDDGSLTLGDLVVQGYYYGIYNDDDGDVTVANSTVQDNYVGIYFDEDGALTVTNSTVQNNSSDGIERDGGCCSNVSDPVTITGSAVRGNGDDGIYNCGGPLTVTDSVVEDNGYLGIDQNCDGLLTVRGTTVQGNGDLNNDGGGIYASDSALIVGSIIADNVGGWGAGLYVDGSIVTINSTTITGNTAAFGGGGIYNETDLTQIYNSTISSNSAGEAGGGIYNDDDNGGTLQLTNSTVSLNTAGTAGGGLLLESYTDVTLRFVTIAGNSAGLDGGGIFAYPNAGAVQDGFNVELLGSIVAGNVDNETTGQTKADCFGTSFVSLGYNLVGATSDCPTGGTGDIAFTGDIASVLDTTLADNGGPTPTHALVANSPAQSKVPAATCASSDGANGRDQRGFARPVGLSCDIGAYEANPQETCVSPFADVADASVACTAIVSLTQMGVINGYATTPATFGPDDPVQRAQMAAFIVRAFHWQNLPTGPRDFNDISGQPGDLAPSVRILANVCDTNLPGDTGCIARGYGDGRFGPTDQVSYAQVISFVARAFEANGNYNWEPQPGAPLPYSGVPGVHANDIRTYTFYAGAIPDAPSTDIAWNAPAPREWVARVLYQALQTAP